MGVLPRSNFVFNGAALAGDLTLACAEMKWTSG